MNFLKRGSLGAVLLMLPATATFATTAPPTDRARYEGCVAAINVDAVRAEEFGKQWYARGGGLPARHCTALAQMHRLKYDEATETLSKAAAEAEAAGDPMASEFWGQAGNAALLTGKTPEAKTHFDKAIAVTPAEKTDELGLLYIDRAQAEVELEAFDAARADIDRAMELRPKDPMAWALSAALARRQDDLTRALYDIAQASELDPSDPDIMFEQANIAATNGDEDAARKIWQRVLQIAPDSEAARLSRQQLGE